VRRSDEDDEREFQRLLRAVSVHPSRVAPRRARERFVKVPLWWIETAAKAPRSPRTLVLIELLYASWRARSLTFHLPNSRLHQLGINREIKSRVMRDLERAGLIVVERPPRKTPVVTLVVL
jgi:hypothetical protein